MIQQNFQIEAEEEYGGADQTCIRRHKIYFAFFSEKNRIFFFSFQTDRSGLRQASKIENFSTDSAEISSSK